MKPIWIVDDDQSIRFVLEKALAREELPVRSFTNQDSDFTSADLIGSNATDTSIDTYTQELRVASDFEGPLNFLLASIRC